MDIEDRADKYAEKHTPTEVDGLLVSDDGRRRLSELLSRAYLAGSAQTQKDYARHFLGFLALLTN